VPAETVVPPQLNTAYQGLLRLAAQHGNTHSDAVQGLLWKIRLSASGTLGAQDLARLSLSPQEQQLLLQVDPNALGSVQSIMTVPLGEQAGQFALGLTRSLLKQVSPELAGLADATVFQSLIDGDYQKVAQSIAQKVVNIPIPSDNSAFTSLSPSVAARAVSESGGYHSLSIDLANNDDGEAFFLPSSCVCQSTRPVQRLALQPPLQAFQTSQAEYPFSPIAESSLEDRVIRSDLFSNYNPRFFRKTAAVTPSPTNTQAPREPYRITVYPPANDNIKSANDNVEQSNKEKFGSRLAKLAGLAGKSSLGLTVGLIIGDEIIDYYCNKATWLSYADCRAQQEKGIPEALENAVNEALAGCYDKTSDRDNPKQCPPCSPYPVGTVGHIGPEVGSSGIDAGRPHYHLFIVEQIPSTCQCIWKEKTKSLTGQHHYYEQPNMPFSVNLNNSGRPPRYPQ
jgi:hypothetical protein